MLFTEIPFAALYHTVGWCLFLTTDFQIKERLETDPKACLQKLFFTWLGAFLVFAFITSSFVSSERQLPWFGIGLIAFLFTHRVTNIYLGWTSIKAFFSGLFRGGPALQLALGVYVLEFMWHLMDYIWELYFPKQTKMSYPSSTSTFYKGDFDELNLLKGPLPFITAMILAFMLLVGVRTFLLDLSCKVKTALEQNSKQVLFQIFAMWIVLIDIYLICIKIFEVDLWPEIRNASSLATCVAFAKHSLDSAMVVGWLFVTATDEGEGGEVGYEKWKHKIGVVAILSAVDVFFRNYSHQRYWN